VVKVINAVTHFLQFFIPPYAEKCVESNDKTKNVIFETVAEI